MWGGVHHYGGRRAGSVVLCEKTADGGSNAKFWLHHAQCIDLMRCVTEPVLRRRRSQSLFCEIQTGGATIATTEMAKFGHGERSPETLIFGGNGLFPFSGAVSVCHSAGKRKKGRSHQKSIRSSKKRIVRVHRGSMYPLFGKNHTLALGTSSVNTEQHM